MRAVTIIARWLLGTALVSWRYMWHITPLHRSERTGSLDDDTPPALPATLVDETMQLADSGVGPLFRRQFRAEITGTTTTAHELIKRVEADFKRFVPSEVVDVHARGETGGALAVGDELVIEMPGPWDGPVRVVHATDTCLRLATLRGHLEAGQVQFHAWPDNDLLVFEIQAWARPSTALVNWLYCHLRLAKEIQLNMWVRFCRAAAADAGGRLRDGVQIRTHELPQHACTQAVSD